MTDNDLCKSNYELAKEIVDKYKHVLRPAIKLVAKDAVRTLPKRYTFSYYDDGSYQTHEDAIVLRTLVRTFLFDELGWEFMRCCIQEEIKYRKEEED